MNSKRKRIGVIVLSILAAVALYALLGFLAVPYFARDRLVAHVERDLGHRLSLGAVRLNPFTFRLELTDIDLREPDGRPLFAAQRLAADLEAASLWRRAWTFAAIEADAPRLNFELRPGGRHNFSALLDALRDPKPQPDKPLPALAIGRIAVDAGRIDLADPRAGEAARLTLAPIAFELTELTTEVSDTAPYTLTARSAEGERIEWRGELSLNPAASSGHLALQGWKVATLVRLAGNRLSLQRAAGTIDAALDYRASFEGGKSALALTNVQAGLAGLALQNQNEAEPFVAADRLQLSAGTIDPIARTFTLERIELARPAIDVSIAADGTPSWARMVTAAGASAPVQPGTTTSPPAAPSAAPPATPDAGSSATARPAAPPAADAAPAAAWRGRLNQLAISDGRIAYADRRQDGATLALSGLDIALGGEFTPAQAGTSVALAEPRIQVAQLSARAGARQLEAGALALSAAAVDLSVADTLQAVANSLAADLGSIALTEPDAGWQTGKVALRAERLQFRPAGGAQLAAVALDAAGIVGRAGQRSNALEAASASVRVQTLAWDAPAAGVRLEGTAAALEALHVRDPASGDTLARLARAELTGAAVASAERRIALDAVTLIDPNATAVVTAGGKSNWDALLDAFGARGAQPAAPKPAAAAPWNVAAKRIEVKNLGGSYSDRRYDPPLAVTLAQVSVRARNASTERKRPMPIELSGRINEAGRFNASGRVDLQAPAADLKVKVSDVSLLPLQPFLARYARVQIVSALASADGRVRYKMGADAGADLVFEGELGLDKLDVEETEPAQPFLSAAMVHASQTRLTLGPDRLEIADLRLDKLSTRLLIAEDQSVNIVKLLRQPQAAPAAKPAASPPAKTPPPAAAPASAASPPAPPADGDDDAFPIVISRVRLDNSVLEFADLSLRPQFKTRMHELQGVVTGISTATTTRARMELEARVDEFGSASIQGVMNLFKPHAFTDVTLVFRNLEMTDLTPYAAKFAGYRIASGKLSMDLHYRIRNRALVGENKIVVDKLVLGERVESPTALDLPLELAIAILQDENGRIDIGLPVSGSLDDPQFSIAGIVWKAIGSLLGRVVTAPFRALARLFGGGAAEEELDKIGFAAGTARIAPPERQKLETVAQALAKRPELKLILKPVYAPEGDRDALRSVAVRRDVLARAGVKLAPGEAPGPLDYGNARIRQAIEDVFTDAFGFPAARDLRAEVAKSAPRKPPAPATPSSATPAPAAPGDGTDAGAKPKPAAPQAANVRVARAMTERLMQARSVSEAELNALAQSRGEAIATALRDSAKVDPARIATAAPQAVSAGAEGTVDVHMELGVSK